MIVVLSQPAQRRSTALIEAGRSTLVANIIPKTTIKNFKWVNPPTFTPEFVQ